jgi:predicted acyltransferase
VTSSSITSRRLDSLDVFRGLTIAAMILVSTPGDWEAVYWPLDHAAWNGWTPTDLVFPFLLFAMGAAVPIALPRRRDPVRRVHRHVLRRASVLFGLGLLLNAIEAPAPLHWATFRMLGVLQRFALVYLAVAWLTERTSRRTQAVVALVILVGYWAAMMLIPVPGVGAGVLTPEGNLASFIDRALLGAHLAHPMWESEGLLSTIPAVATALGGVFAGDWLTRTGRARHRSASLWLIGVAVAAIGLLWGRVFPINKSLWTSSFALFSAGMATQLLAICHWALDLHRWRGWSAPFLPFGRNALAAYFLSVGLDSLLGRWPTAPQAGPSLKWDLYWYGFGSWGSQCCGAKAASLAYAVAYTALFGLLVTLMHRRRVFIRI